MEEKKSGGKVAAVVGGLGLGAWAGAGIGIAGAFGAISGVLPVALIGGYLGHKLHKSVTSGEAGKLVADFKKGYTASYTETADRLREARARVEAHQEDTAPTKKP